MNMATLFYVWWIFCVLFSLGESVASGNGTLLGFTSLKYGHRLGRRLVNTFPSYSVMDCATECLKTTRCASLNYHTGARYCEINYQSQNETSALLVKDATWIYSERQDWDTRLAGLCADVTCAVNEKCEVDGDGIAWCVLSDCGVPVNSQPTTDDLQRSDAIAVGRKMHMRCSDQHGEQVRYDEHRCLPNGQWQSSNVTCNVCESGWHPYSSHCYFFNTSVLSWDEARIQCERHSAYLVEIDQDLENDWLANHLQLAIDPALCPDEWACSAWIGANDREMRGVYKWSLSARPVELSKWYFGQPDDHRANCVRMLRLGFWDDSICDIPFSFICEK